MAKLFCPYCMNPVEEGESCPVCGLTAGCYEAKPHHLPPGTVLLDRYLVGRVIGEGGFGITYIGRDLRLELKVAIKEYYPVDRASRAAEASTSVSAHTGPAKQSFEMGKEKFLEEARVMARLDKLEAIVSVKDFFEANNTAYIVMEYIQGTTFHDLVEQQGGRIAPGELFAMVEPLFGALTAMHDNGLIHRDISPENLMLENGRVRLLDFGCARETAEGNATLTVALKHGYAPVEQYQQKGQGPWTDLYALCATLYYCLVGKAPPQALDRMVGAELVMPSTLGVEISLRQEAALHKGLAIKPTRRYHSMAELHGALYGDAAVTEEEDLPDKQDPVQTAAGAMPEPAEAGSPQSGEREEKKGFAGVLKSLPMQAYIAAAAAVVALTACAAILWNSGRAAVDPGGPAQAFSAVSTDSETAEPAEPDAEPAALLPDRAVFESEGAVSGTFEDKDGFSRALEDDGVTAIVLEEGADISSLAEGLTVTKPVLVRSGAALQVNNLTVEETGSVLVLEGGSLILENTRLKGGGVRIFAQENARLEWQGGFCWMDAADNVRWEAHNLAGERMWTVPAALPGEGESVTSYDQLLAALQTPRGNLSRVKVISIDGDMTIPDDMGWAGNIVLRVSEGVTVDGPGAIGVNDSIVLNFGTLAVNIHAGDSRVINYGSMVSPDSDGGCWIGLGSTVINCGSFTGDPAGSIWVESGGMFVNYGAADLAFASRVWEESSLVNMPEGRLTAYNLYFDGGSFINYGTVEVPYKANDPEKRLWIDGLCTQYGGNIANFGTIHVERDGQLQNRGEIFNYGGLLDLENGGDMYNTVLENTGTVRVRGQGSFSGAANGIVYGPGEFNGLAGNVKQLNIYPDTMEKAALFTDGESFISRYAEGAIAGPAALQGTVDLDPGSGTLQVTEDLYILGDVTLHGTLAVEGVRVFIEDSSSLTVDGLQLGSDAILWNDGGLTVQAGGSVEIAGGMLTGYGDYRLNSVQMHLTDNGVFLDKGVSRPRGGRRFELEDATVVLESESQLVLPPESLERTSFTVAGGAALYNLYNVNTVADQCSFVLQDGGLFMVHGCLRLQDCRLEIGEGGAFTEVGSDLVFSGSTGFVNNGGMTLGGLWTERSVTFSNTGEMINNGYMRLASNTNFGSSSVIVNRGEASFDSENVDARLFTGNAPIDE